MVNWIELGVPEAPIAYRGQSDSLEYQNKKTGHVLHIANIFGMGSFNVILIKETGRILLAEGMPRENAIDFAKDWMKDNPEG